MEASMPKEPLMILSTSRRVATAASPASIWPAVATAAAMLMVGAMLFI
jgi:hypothetical protein